MQRWEYCEVAPAEVTFFTREGRRTTDFYRDVFPNMAPRIDVQEYQAQLSARLGIEGWELVNAIGESNLHARVFFFKRPLA